jgi:hypothetical protein
LNVVTITTHQFFGLLELDARGTVLYSRAESDGDQNRQSDDLIGQNFYSVVATFKNAWEFRRLIERFAKSREQAGSFTFVCKYEDSDVSVKVLLARIREQSEGRSTKAILVHIKKAA